jgi:glucose dehydrogenase
LLACNPEPTTSPSDVAQQEPVVEFDDGGESVEILTTHWINESDIGDGNGPATDALLLAPQNEASDRWIQFGGDYSNQRHSPIEALSPENVENLKFEWGLPTGTIGQFAASPLVYDGIMYVTSSYNRLFAVDARTGEIFWRYDHQLPEDLRLCCGPANRGASIHGDTILMATLDARILAFDRMSGRKLW